MSTKAIKWIIIVVVIIIIIAVAWYFISGAGSVKNPNKTNTPLPAGTPASQSKWIPEAFPLNIGMYGTKIKALQSALGITADGKFGTQTSGAITSAAYTIPLSQTDYNAIVSPGTNTNTGTSAIGKFAYAAADGTTLYNPNYSVNRTFSADEFVGKVVKNAAGTSADNYTINGGFIIPVADVYLKS